MAAEKSPRRLGRGLEALLKHNSPPSQSVSRETTSDGSGGTPAPVVIQEDSPLKEIEITSIRANQYQPRKAFKAEELEDLKNSIAATGLLQPITVRLLNQNGHYELVAGERRFRAVQLLGWTKITAIVRDYDDQTMLTLALVENLQRSDLNPIEEAEGYQRLGEEFSLTQAEIARLVGKDRSTVANLMRILQLPSAVKDMIEAGQLTPGHARPLLSLDDDVAITRMATEISKLGLSVRAVEERIRQENSRSKMALEAASKGPLTHKSEAATKAADVKYVEDLLRKRLQTDVSIDIKHGERGQVNVQFYSYADLNRLLELMDALE